MNEALSASDLHVQSMHKAGLSLVSTWMGELLGKTRLLMEEVLVRPAGGAHPVVCVGPNAPV